MDDEMVRQEFAGIVNQALGEDAQMAALFGQMSQGISAMLPRIKGITDAISAYIDQDKAEGER